MQFMAVTRIYIKQNCLGHNTQMIEMKKTTVIKCMLKISRKQTNIDRYKVTVLIKDTESHFEI